MRLTLQQLHKRLTNDHDRKGSFAMTTNNNMEISYTDKITDEKWKIIFIGAAIVKFLDSCKHYVICIDSFGEREIKVLPDILELLEKKALHNLEVHFENPSEDNLKIRNEDLTFTGKVYIETNELTIPKDLAHGLIGKFGIKYKDKRVHFIIRDNKDWDDIENPNKIKLFLCHDSTDKEYVEKVYGELLWKSFDPWLDKAKLELGDSLIEKISDGLNKADFAIIFISKHFLSNDKWVKYELHSLITKQVSENRKVIFPIWVDIDESDLKDHLWLKDKFAINSKDGLQLVVDQIIKSAKNEKERIAKNNEI
jgi:hypothetical protein